MTILPFLITLWLHLPLKQIVTSLRLILHLIAHRSDICHIFLILNEALHLLVVSLCQSCIISLECLLAEILILSLVIISVDLIKLILVMSLIEAVIVLRHRLLQNRWAIHSILNYLVLQMLAKSWLQNVFLLPIVDALRHLLDVDGIHLCLSGSLSLAPLCFIHDLIGLIRHRDDIAVQILRVLIRCSA